MTINKNSGVNYKMDKDLINNILKDVIKEDKVDTLISMIRNGLDLNDFSYDNFRGINAIMAYCIDCEENEGKAILGYLLENIKFSEIDPSVLSKLRQFDSKKHSINEHDIEVGLEDICGFISDGVKAIFGLEDDVQIKLDEIEGVSNFIDFLKKGKDSSPSSNDNTNVSEEVKEKTKEAVKNPDNQDSNKSKAEPTNRPNMVGVDYGNHLVKSVEDTDSTVSEDNMCKNTSKKIEIKPSNTSLNSANSKKKIELVQTTKEDSINNTSNNFTMVGESNYKVASINAYVTFENTSTCETNSISITADSVEDFTNKVKESIVELNNKNDEKLLNSVMEMMQSNSEFKNDLLKMVQEAQIKSY